MWGPSLQLKEPGQLWAEGRSSLGAPVSLLFKAQGDHQTAGIWQLKGEAEKTSGQSSFCTLHTYHGQFGSLSATASLVTQMVKHLPAMWETWVQSRGQEEPLGKEMATHSSTLAWKIPWIEEPGRLQSMGSQRVRHD